MSLAEEVAQIVAMFEQKWCSCVGSVAWCVDEHTGACLRWMENRARTLIAMDWWFD